jgi:hypothetical protein
LQAETRETYRLELCGEIRDRQAILPPAGRIRP